MRVRDTGTWLLYLGSSGAGGDLESAGRGHVREDHGAGLFLGPRVRQRPHLLEEHRDLDSHTVAQIAAPLPVLPGSSLTFLENLESLV